MTNTDFTARCMAGKALEDVAGKQDVIADLDTIRAGAAAGATAVQPADMTTALAAKQDVLTTEQLAAVNSGITSTNVEQIETNKNNILSIAYDYAKSIYAVSNVVLSGSGFVIPDNTPVTMPKSEYILHFESTTARTGTFVAANGSTDVYRNSFDIAEGNNVLRFTTNADCDNIRFVVSASVTITNLVLLKAIYYDSGRTDYIPAT